MTNEQLAHDLAIAVVTAKLEKKSNPNADVSVVNDYDMAYRQLLSIVKQTR
ncbi:hypothetical protein Lp90_1021 [Lactiplantibacillus plantarum]|uniref:hypothetical protein n=1 Tax=Lactiplantibacillus plantarum TaxID=1590 RepID=UPI0004DD17D8|nr:hypothetical protein [Lactiplantibacillus plantarum]KEZ14837.1 hypothetical protein Lp90_1021 [Lactiplantibacillus plantarum]